MISKSWMKSALDLAYNFCKDYVQYWCMCTCKCSHRIYMKSLLATVIYTPQEHCILLNLLVCESWFSLFSTWYILQWAHFVLHRKRFFSVSLTNWFFVTYPQKLPHHQRFYHIAVWTINIKEAYSSICEIISIKHYVSSGLAT